MLFHKQNLLVCLVFSHCFIHPITILLIVFMLTPLFGCGPDTNTFAMHIRDVNISVFEVDKTLYYVIAHIYAVAGPTTCYGHHKTDYLHRDDYAGQPLYRDGDTIEISISAYGSADVSVCSDAVSMHDEVIFIGFCAPGSYTLRVNDFTKKFTVGTTQ